MERCWITNGSTSIPPVANPLAAACHEGFVPDRVHLLTNPGIEPVTAPTTATIEDVVAAHAGEPPAIEVTSLTDERDFEAIVEYLRDAIEAGRDAGAEVAVDVTPGRKFWSIISFRAGLEADVEHLYYAHVAADEYFGHSFATIPRTAFDLVDFTEVL